MCLNHHPRAHDRRRSARRALAVVALVTGALLTTDAAANATMAMGAGAVLAQAESVEQVLDNVRGWIVGILALLATVFLTIGGVRYILGGGDPGEIEKAKVAFRSACVGYALAVLAPLVVTVLQGIVGA